MCSKRIIDLQIGDYLYKEGKPAGFYYDETIIECTEITELKVVDIEHLTTEKVDEYVNGIMTTHYEDVNLVKFKFNNGDFIVIDFGIKDKINRSYLKPGEGVGRFISTSKQEVVDYINERLSYLLKGIDNKIQKLNDESKLINDKIEYWNNYMTKNG